jgi:hypothetical protein
MKTLQKDDERAAIKLWKAQVPLSKITAQLKMSAESDTRRILAFAFQPTDPITSMPERVQAVINWNTGMTKY